jgi:hypothetical protein
MALIKSVSFDGDEIYLQVSISNKEYRQLQPSTKDIMVLPTNSLEDTLTVGKLGNSNRIMLPKKTQKRYNIETLPKRAKAKIFELGNSKYLLINLSGKKIGVPNFEKG